MYGSVAYSGDIKMAKMGAPPKPGGAKKGISVKLPPPAWDVVVQIATRFGLSNSGVAAVFVQEGILSMNRNHNGVFSKLQEIHAMKEEEVARVKSKTDGHQKSKTGGKSVP